MSSTTTDGGGAFVISGLPDGALPAARRARASRRGATGVRGGTAAKTGDTNVTIVLPAPGELNGKIVIEGRDGRPPDDRERRRSAQQPPTPRQKGEFTVRDLTPGTYDVTFRGLEFAEIAKRDIKIEAGKTTDLGTVTVMRGRQLDRQGRRRAAATRVAGAKIRVGEMLFSVEGRRRSQRAVSRRSTASARPRPTRPASSRSSASRRRPPACSPSTPTSAARDATPIAGRHRRSAADHAHAARLRLDHRQGHDEGQAGRQGRGLRSAKGGGAAAAFAQSDDEGKYTIAKVPEGEQVVQAMKTGMMEMKTGTATITVTAGKQSTVNIEIPVGEIALTVTIKPLPNHKVDAAQVFLFSGIVAMANGKQLTDAMFQGGAAGHEALARQGAPDARVRRARRRRLLDVHDPDHRRSVRPDVRRADPGEHPDAEGLLQADQGEAIAGEAGRDPRPAVDVAAARAHELRAGPKHRKPRSNATRTTAVSTHDPSSRVRGRSPPAHLIVAVHRAAGAIDVDEQEVRRQRAVLVPGDPVTDGEPLAAVSLSPQ